MAKKKKEVEMTIEKNEDVLVASLDVSKMDRALIEKEYDECILITGAKHKFDLKFDNGTLSKTETINFNDKFLKVLKRLIFKTDWQSTEAFFVKYVYEGLNQLTFDRESMSYKVSYDIIEAAWRFVVKYKSQGYDEAVNYTIVANGLSNIVAAFGSASAKLTELAPILQEFDRLDSLKNG